MQIPENPRLHLDLHKQLKPVIHQTIQVPTFFNRAKLQVNSSSINYANHLRNNVVIITKAMNYSNAKRTEITSNDTSSQN